MLPKPLALLLCGVALGCTSQPVDPANAAGAVAKPKIKTTQTIIAPDMVQQPDTIIAPDMVQKPTHIIAPDMVQKPDAIIAPDMVQKPTPVPQAKVRQGVR